MNARARARLLLALSLYCAAVAAEPTRQLALAWQDHLLRIAVARQQLSAEQADTQLRAFAERVASTPEADQMHALRQGLDRAFEDWLGTIEQQAATTATWPDGRSAADWQLLVQLNVAQLRDAMFDALVADEDPLPILEKAAQVAGWTRGEQLPAASLPGHAQRVAALLDGKPMPLTQRLPEVQQVASAQPQRLHFDPFKIGPLPPDAFAQDGVRIVARDGVPGIYASDASMLLPAGRSRVLLIAGERTTSLSFEFAAPIRRFSLTRIGTAGGSSVPTWTLQAFDRTGTALDSTGEQFSLPTQPQQFSVNGAGIVRVVLSTDNRYGEGTLATWNSLPLVEFEFGR